MTDIDTIEWLQANGLSETQAHQLSAGYDLMRDAGYSNEKIEFWLGGALRNGDNPELVARKIIQFGRIMKEGAK